MDSREQDKVMAFDTLFCTNHIQMLKVLLPYMDHQTQKSMAVYIKFLELNYTIEYFKKHPYPLYGPKKKEASDNIPKICAELLPYCTEEEKTKLAQIKSLYQGMEMYREMSKNMDIIKDLMPGAGESESPFPFSAENNSGFDITELLMNMLTPEQKQMYEMFGGEHHAE